MFLKQKDGTGPEVPPQSGMAAGPVQIDSTGEGDMGDVKPATCDVTPRGHTYATPG